MSATDKLIEELRDSVTNCRDLRPKHLAPDFWPELANEIERAADTISALKEENERLRVALEPFATDATEWGGYDDEEPLVEGFPGYAGTLTVGTLRRAARALSDTGETG